MDDADYRRAEAFLPWNLYKHFHNSAIFPYWGNGTLYYFRWSDNDCHLLKVGLATGEKKVLFNIQKIIDVLSRESGESIEAWELSPQKFNLENEGQALCLRYGGYRWLFSLDGDFITKEIEINHVLVSPDQSKMIKVESHNLVLINAKDGSQEVLTQDGQPYYDYASSPETNTRIISDKLARIVRPPVAIWSNDSTKFITHKLDQRDVEKLYLLESAPEGKQRPILHEYRMSFSGDKHLPQATLVIFDVVNKMVVHVKREPTLSPYLTPIEYDWVWWSPDGHKVYFLEESRGSKRLSFCVADAITGSVDVLIEECSDTYVEPCDIFLWKTNISVLEKRNGVIWMSMCDGYPHLYYYEIGEKQAKYAITKGEWSVRELLYYDENDNWLYFTAVGYYPSLDPYYRQIFRCRLDGSELTCLSKDRLDHAITISPANNCYIDNASTINTAPAITLRKMDGSVVSVLEEVDLKYLQAMKWVPPVRFHEKGSDGETDIYGNMYLPSNFDKTKKYPIIDHIYPGPQVFRTAQNFSLYTAIFRSPWVAQALAELGFIVIHMDGAGTPGRSAKFHHASYGNMADGGLSDHAAVMTHLIKKHSFIDGDRIGITGYSGGGYAAVRAMLMYPDLYKVGVAAAGNHDLRCYPASYGEKYSGLDALRYEKESNASLAQNLKGKLLLIHGDMDDNVHPCATMQLISELIKHNKDFDMLILPNMNHRTTFDHPYCWRRHWDYLVSHLLMCDPPKSYQFNKIMPEWFPQVYEF